MLSFLVAWILAALVINFCVRFFFKTTPRRMIYDSVTNPRGDTGYLNGYLAGITNVKMYYYVIGDMPTSNWLDGNKFKMLNTRPLLLNTIDEETKRGAGIID